MQPKQGAPGLWKEGEPPGRYREMTHVKGTSAVWGPRVGTTMEEPGQSRPAQGWTEAGGQVGMGPPAGTSRSTREDRKMEGAQKQQKETALLQSPMPQLLRPPGTMGTLCPKSHRPLF